jgi:ABC-2 type transport system ATP-binding protein
VWLRIPEGECFGLAGPNGAGKSTLIRILLGLAAPDEGQVRLFGRNPEDPELRRRVGFVPEAAELPASASPRGLVKRWVKLRGLSRSAEAQGLATLERLGMGPLLDRAAGSLSKGERQRTLLSLALLGEPELLVLDEPTDGLDPLGRALVREVIREQGAAGRTVFLNSHLLAETERVCSRVCILHRGELVREAQLLSAGATARATSVVLLDLLPPAQVLEAARARLAPPGRRLLRELQREDAGVAVLLEHGSPVELNASLDALRGAGALLLELRPLRADLEAVLIEAAEGPADVEGLGRSGMRAVALPETGRTRESETNAGAPPAHPEGSRGASGNPGPSSREPESGADARPSTPLGVKGIGAPLMASPPAWAEDPLPPAPPVRLNLLRTARAIRRVAGEITAELASQKIGWMMLLAAVVGVTAVYRFVESQLMLSLVQASRSAIAQVGALELERLTRQLASVSGQSLTWLLFGMTTLMASLFAVPLLDPRRTVLVYAQPISRSDYALGLFCGVVALAAASCLVYSGLLFLMLRWLGLPISPRLLLIALPFALGFAPLYCVVLLATLVRRSGFFAALCGMAALIGCATLSMSDAVTNGTSGSFTLFVYALTPKLAELAHLAGRLAEGGTISLTPVLSTLAIDAALLLVLVIVVRRSES